MKTFFLANEPINGFSGNVRVVIVTLFTIGCLLFVKPKGIAIIGLIPIAYRIKFLLLLRTKTKKIVNNREDIEIELLFISLGRVCMRWLLSSANQLKS
ncbi:hypothetical protein [Aquibacillus sediminis]|uniref:hypothetical protein n=1 Tax=Aquibacillus sediminis TaxID=2574734 RepID=UPI0014867E9C|nr:hypothetical protein [Aquibacillus sediminis]